MCPHVALGCGGCALISLDYRSQLEAKENEVRADAETYPRLSLSVEPVHAAPTIEAYRTRAKLMVQDARVGLYREGTHQLIDIPSCRVLSRPLLETAQVVRDVLTSHPSFASTLRAVDLREARDPTTKTTTILLTWVVARDAMTDATPDAMAAANATLASSLTYPVTIARSERDEDAVLALGDAPTLVRGDARIRDAGPHAWSYASHGSFVQAHRGVAALALDRIARALPERKHLRVLDVYAGAGSIALDLAAAGSHVHMIESYAPAVTAALDAAKAQGLSLTADARSAELGLQGCVARGERFDVVVCNPPRRGMAREARTHIGTLAPERILYLSCNHRTLLRDLEHFAALGYRTEALEPFDMIPLTDHVEVFAELRKAPIESPTRLAEKEGAQIIDVRPSTVLRGPLAHLVRPLRGAEEALGATLLLDRALDPRPELTSTWIALATGIMHRKGRLRSQHESLGSYKRERVIRGASLVTITTTTRRIDILRRTLTSLGHPIVGDERFGDPKTNRHYLERYGLDYPFLHCSDVRWQELHAQAPLTGLLLALTT